MLIPIIGLAKRWTFYIGVTGKVLFIDKDVKPDSAGDDVARSSRSSGFPGRSSFG